jgi:Asp-tRNA(Asn)/Glu-tRNA(Gln) amidotransferase A subunit family amidase
MQDGEQNEKYLPALFGVPISIKDNLEMAGTRSTVGLTKRANIIIKNDGALVKCFKNGGMIPFVKTNIPQLGFTT